MTKLALTDEYRTPPWLFTLLDKTFGPFFWDACCSQNNCLVPQGRHGDILVADHYDYLASNLPGCVLQGVWHSFEAIFMNPPYSNPLPFIKKAWEDSKHFRVVLLVRDDPSTEWYQFLRNGGKQTSTNPADNKYQTYYVREFAEKNFFDINARSKSRFETGEFTRLFIRFPKRIKFYGNEEMLAQDASKHPDKVKCGWHSKIDSDHVVLETKNFIRKDDGIECKNSYNFPVCVIVLDRRRELQI